VPGVPAATSHEVRKATAADVPALGRVLARAFLDDPVAQWSCPSDRRRPRMNERFFSVRLRQLLDQEQIYMTPDTSGAALWALPDRWRTSPRELLGLAPLIPTWGRRLPRVIRGLLRVEDAHPETPPHFHLAVLGTEPSRQGEGIGSALLGPVLELCDRDHVPAYLESSKESNIAFYARHGFRVTGEINLPNGPPVWPMWRTPR
jgi:ribosomal protein S18 acetylase RimI-like enzyme